MAKLRTYHVAIYWSSKEGIVYGLDTVIVHYGKITWNTIDSFKEQAKDTFNQIKDFDKAKVISWEELK